MATASDSQNLSISSDIISLFCITQLKSEQQKVVECLLKKQDCMAVLPTGYGKSLPFQLYAVHLKKQSNSVGGKVVVCCPLNALMIDQVEKLSKIPDIRAEYAGASRLTDTAIKEGEVDLIYGSPEMLVGDDVWREAIQKLDVELIVVDEFHTIATWGEGENGLKQAFRKWFSYVGELRALCPKANVLALSATCTVKIRDRVMKIMHLNKAKEISISPNKTNIKVCVSKVPNDIEEAMLWAVEGIETLGDNFPKTLVYCNSITDVSKLYSYIIDELPNHSHLISMYHSECTTTCKEKVLSDIKLEDSTLKFIICTDALGMGIDILKCYSVILFGAPNSAVEFIQRIGRAGRDGGSSVALLLYNSFNGRNADQHVKTILKTPECRRLALLTAFDRQVELTWDIDRHNCCDICASKCTCENCASLKLEELFRASPCIEDVHSQPPSDDESTISYNLSEYEEESDLMQHMDNIFM